MCLYLGDTDSTLLYLAADSGNTFFLAVVGWLHWGNRNTFLENLNE